MEEREARKLFNHYQGRFMVRIFAVLFMLSVSAPLWSAPQKRFIIKYKKGVLKTNSSKSKNVFIKSLKEESIEELKKNPSIEYIEEDTILRAYRTPGDTEGVIDKYYSKQWHYRTAPGGANLEAAWDITIGSSDVVIAVLDTGILYHVDLETRILPGQDMISDTFIANDGDGRDSDATDPGDFVTESDRCGFTSQSSWHGTHVAGTIGANTGNEIGVAGVMWRSKILPIRVLGKCGGYTSDIADGIRWAAGIEVDGLPINPYPAKIINLSLGGRGECGRYIQDAIDSATEKGSLIVVAAGNSNQNLDEVSYSPASCKNVITVGAVNYDGDRAQYSNYGQRIDIMAPGGENDYRVLSTSNTGTTTSGDDAYVFQMGTSMASPHVAGVAGLVAAFDKTLSPLQIKEAILKNSRNFDTKSNCHESNRCGNGLLDAYKALSSLQLNIPPEVDPIEPEPETPPSDDGHCGETTEKTQSSSFFLSFVLGIIGTCLKKR